MVARGRSCGVDVSGKWSDVSGGDVQGRIWAFRAQRAPVPYNITNNGVSGGVVRPTRTMHCGSRRGLGFWSLFQLVFFWRLFGRAFPHFLVGCLRSVASLQPSKRFGTHGSDVVTYFFLVFSPFILALHMSLISTGGIIYFLFYLRLVFDMYGNSRVTNTTCPRPSTSTPLSSWKSIEVSIIKWW